MFLLKITVSNKDEIRSCQTVRILSDLIGYLPATNYTGSSNKMWKFNFSQIIELKKSFM